MSVKKILPCLLLLAVGWSCKASKSSHAVHVPGEDATIDDYEQMLEQSEGALAEIGIKASEPGASRASAADATGADMEAEAGAPTPEAASSDDGSTANAGSFNGDCKTLCDLSSTTCELEARICVLATRHEGDARYENACTRAGNDCSLAEGVADNSCECEY